MAERRALVPGWACPIAGPILGALGGYRASSRSGPALQVAGVVLGGSIGLAAGLLFWWVDRRRER